MRLFHGVHINLDDQIGVSLCFTTAFRGPNKRCAVSLVYPSVSTTETVFEIHTLTSAWFAKCRYERFSTRHDTREKSFHTLHKKERRVTIIYNLARLFHNYFTCICYSTLYDLIWIKWVLREEYKLHHWIRESVNRHGFEEIRTCQKFPAQVQCLPNDCLSFVMYSRGSLLVTKNPRVGKTDCPTERESENSIVERQTRGEATADYGCCPLIYLTPFDSVTLPLLVVSLWPIRFSFCFATLRLIVR